MNDKIFLDSNILIYCYTNSDIHKQNIARSLATKKNTVISTQVLNETTNILFKKYGISWVKLEDLINDFEKNFFIHTLTSNDIRNACRIADRYKFSFYDSMIISSAIECNCNVLYSEDLHNTQIIGDIKISNPFV